MIKKIIIILLLLLYTDVFAGDMGIDKMDYTTANVILSWASIYQGGNDSYTEYLLQMNGSDGGLDFYDSSSNSVTVYNNNTRTENTVYVFESSAAYFNGTSAYLYSSDYAELEYESSDWTIDFRVNCASATTSGLDNIYNQLTAPGDNPYTITIGQSSSSLILYISTNGSSWNLVNGSNIQTVTANTWYHIAVERYGTAVNWYSNGTKISSANIGTSAIPTATGMHMIGAYGGSGWVSFFTGWLDEFRITDGLARYQGNNFILPANQYDTFISGITISVDSTTLTEGSSSLDLIIDTTGINEILVKTLATNYNFTGAKDLKVDVRSNRTGSNVAVGFHDTGGDSSFCTVNIDSADTWQKINWDIGNIADSSKNVVDKLYIKAINVDSTNTCNVDNWIIGTGSPVGENGTFAYDTSEGRGDSTNCYKFTPNSATKPLTWEYKFPVTAATEYNIKYYAKMTADFNGSISSTIYDTDHVSVLSNSKAFTGLTTSYVGDTTTLTPAGTGFNYMLLRILGDTGSVYVDDIGE